MRLRFAPSPTGALHIGGARTALYNWLEARRNGGDARAAHRGHRPRALDARERRADPRRAALAGARLRRGPDLAARRAPTATRRRWQQLLDERPRLPLDRDRRGRQARSRTRHGADRGFRGEPTRARARCACACPTRARASCTTSSAATRRFAHVHMDDPVIARADGSVLYNFAVAIDDLDAGITHVDPRRGPPLQHAQAAARARGARRARPPVYAHLPLLHGPDGKKLSKRHGAASVQELRDAGYLPEAVRNYLALLGWGDARRRDDHRHRRARASASTSTRVARNPAQFDEQKLRWMNGRYMRELDTRRADRAPEGRSPAATRPARRGRDLARRRSRRSRTSGRWRASSSTAPATIPRRARSGWATTAARRSRRRATRWRGVDPWTAEALEPALARRASRRAA